MFVIVGFKRSFHRLATILAVCGTCQGPSAQDLCRVRTFLRLFMVPLLPLRSSYRTNCASCGNSTIVSEEQADRLLASGPHVGKVPLPEAVAA